MSARIRAVLARAGTGGNALIEMIRSDGGKVIAEVENKQPDARLQIASIHYAGIIGLGPGLLGAARDWHRQATAKSALQVKP